MTVQKIFIGDSVIFEAMFKNSSGGFIDPDTSEAVATIYNDDDLSQVVQGGAIRISQGIYQYEWTVPDGDGNVYVLEMMGVFNSFPQLNRTKAKARFRP